MTGKHSFFILLFSVLCLVNTSTNAMTVILDTDIGDDIDDTWALAHILCSPEFDLKLVVTDSHNTPMKAQLAAKFLDKVGRADIPVGIGVKTSDKGSPQYEWSKDYDLKKYPGGVYEDGIQAMIDTIREATETVVLFVIGPCPNIPILLERAPDVVDKVKVYAMSGSVYLGYNGVASPDAEYNVRDNIPAAKRLYNAGWDLTIAPLDTAGLIRIKGKPYQDMLQSQSTVVKVLMENYRAWAQEGNRHYVTDSHSSTLYDTVAIYLAHDQSLIEMKDLRLRVDDKGYTVIDPKANVVHTALNWKDMDAYIDYLVKRLSSGVINEKFPEEEEQKGK